MTINSSQKKRSSCEKLMRMMKNLLKFSSFPVPVNDVRTSSSNSPPRRHHQPEEQPKHQKLPNGHQSGGLDGGNIKIQGNDHHEIGRADELKDSVTNLKASDYIRRFHERNQRDSVQLVLPPPPPLPPRFR
ncbi:hypothetical protein L6452_21183 [Arctium lappa]|uniref:Uncharacterized protein n=1 Tax=Arctium lappa TaxID=4217 RepID=A0ACB9BE81_ARCLA|nr:hypothetical protein L6452_21183 [Arctium lappa]